MNPGRPTSPGGWTEPPPESPPAALRAGSAESAAAPGLEQVLAALVTKRVIYFPIRHHSPACARHLEQLIREWRPETILIEGPASFTPLIPLALHPATKTPFAIYTSFVPPAPEPESA